MFFFLRSSHSAYLRPYYSTDPSPPPRLVARHDIKKFIRSLFLKNLYSTSYTDFPSFLVHFRLA